MYLEYFNFKKNPFHITPDPEFLFLSSGHKEAFAAIAYGIEERKGFIAVTGEVGVGKTTILRSYLQRIDPLKNRIIYIFNTSVTYRQLLKQVFFEVGIPVADEEAFELVNRLVHFLVQEYKHGRNVVLIIDEAQNMPIETLESLRTLSNLETAQEKLLQMVLVGQPEFEAKLDLPELRQLKQRIAIRAHISPLTLEESMAYVMHRLMKASLYFTPVFTDDALRMILEVSQGIPRVINITSDNALITGFGYQRNPVDLKIVEEVIRDMRHGRTRVEPISRWRRFLSLFFPFMRPRHGSVGPGNAAETFGGKKGGINNLAPEKAA